MNSDGNGRGFLHADGSHSLQRFVNQVAADVNDPETGATVQERLRARMMVTGNEKGATDEAKRAGEARAAGRADCRSRSARVPTTRLHRSPRHRVARTSATAAKARPDGVYHSLYDSFDHYSRFGDPGFVYGVALAQTAGRIVLRMADADVLPLQLRRFRRHDRELRRGDAQARRHHARERRDLSTGCSTRSFHARRGSDAAVLAPEREPRCPCSISRRSTTRCSALKKSAKACDDASQAARDEVAAEIERDAARQLNATAAGMEQTLLDARGLPQRDWFRHMIYAPGLQTGYGVKTLPGVREAIEGRIAWPRPIAMRWSRRRRWSGIAIDWTRRLR